MSQSNHTPAQRWVEASRALNGQSRVVSALTLVANVINAVIFPSHLLRAVADEMSAESHCQFSMTNFQYY